MIKSKFSEAKANAKDMTSCPRGASRPRPWPRGLHLWLTVVVLGWGQGGTAPPPNLAQAPQIVGRPIQGDIRLNSEQENVHCTVPYQTAEFLSVYVLFNVQRLLVGGTISI